MYPFFVNSDFILKRTHESYFISDIFILFEKNESISKYPPVIGEYANWAGVNESELQTIIDFGFVEPSKEGSSKKGVMYRRMILPPKVAKELGEILSKKKIKK